jgi:hypothetical protein
MKKAILNMFGTALIVSALFSCKKDFCENCLDDFNKLPIANAGLDQVIILPTDSTVINASLSSDPDGSIASYRWSQLSGPGCTVRNSNTMQVAVNNMTMGTYQFLVEVSDNNGRKAADSVFITVLDANRCDLSTRPVVEVSLAPVGTLSVPRTPVAAAAGNKILFAGGVQPYESSASVNHQPSAAVDIYDVSTGGWSVARLSAARTGIAAVSCGAKVFFAGGTDGKQLFNTVDVYDVEKGSWIVMQLSSARSHVAAVAAGDKVLFAGGSANTSIMYPDVSSTVDIYNIATNEWTVTTLRFPRTQISAAAVGDKVFFAGGNYSDLDATMVETYNVATGRWEAFHFNELSGVVSSMAFNDRIYYAGMSRKIPGFGVVEIMNTSGTGAETYCLSYARTAQIDIFNTATMRWRAGHLKTIITGATVVGLKENIYVAGGIEGAETSSKVYRLEW